MVNGTPICSQIFFVLINNIVKHNVLNLETIFIPLQTNISCYFLRSSHI